MLSTISFPQASLAITVVASTIGSFVALSPPYQNVEQVPLTGDAIRNLSLTGKHFRIVIFTPHSLLALHTSTLILLHPRIPQTILRYGAQNGLNTQLITWSPSTSIPLALIICAGIPLRLASYASLGKNFTFTLARPNALKTDGMYYYIQHPSYTGLMIIATCSAALLARPDGVLSCWAPPEWYSALRILELVVAPVGLSAFIFALFARVRQEERMLRAEFGTHWEIWHGKTARFIPYFF
jgi:protein-S-isoprenylcysteine O-methyltransferase Ste14